MINVETQECGGGSAVTVQTASGSPWNAHRLRLSDILAPDSFILSRVLKNEGVSGDIHENKGGGKLESGIRFQVSGKSPESVVLKADPRNPFCVDILPPDSSLLSPILKNEDVCGDVDENKGGGK